MLTCHARENPRKNRGYARKHTESARSIFFQHTQAGTGVKDAHGSRTPWASRGLLIRDDVDVIVPLIVGQHHGDSDNERLVLRPVQSLHMRQGAMRGSRRHHWEMYGQHAVTVHWSSRAGPVVCACYFLRGSSAGLI